MADLNKKSRKAKFLYGLHVEVFDFFDLDFKTQNIYILFIL
jgi:hypothetical protein